MAKRCGTCGKKLADPRQTHCSDKCLFETIKNSEKFVPQKLRRQANWSNPKKTHRYSRWQQKNGNKSPLFFEAYDIRWNKK